MAARVVLADDHPLFLAALETAVEAAGITVVGTASRGDELLELMVGVTVDAVLLDLQMPGYDGFECIDQLRRLYPGLRLIVVSATDGSFAISVSMSPLKTAHRPSTGSTMMWLRPIHSRTTSVILMDTDS